MNATYKKDMRKWTCE